MHDHVSSVCTAAYFELRKIASVRPYLTKSATVQVISSLNLSRLDYCSSVLAGLSSDELSRLQRIQNNSEFAEGVRAARLVFQKSRRDRYTTPLLLEQHWLPVKCRIE